MSIRIRLTAWYTGILAVTLILFSASIYGFVRYNTYQEVKNRLEDQANRIISSQGFSITQGLDLTLNPKQAERLEYVQLYAQIHNYVNGFTRYSQNMLDQQMEFPIPDPQTIPEQIVFQNVTLEDNSFLMCQVPVYLNNNLIAILQLAAYTGAEDRLMERMKSVLIFGFFITIVIASTLGLFLARKSMTPIEKVIQAANGIQTGNDLSVRIDYDGPNDEIGQLIGTVNGMLSRTEGFYNELDDAYKAQRRFVSDASHELRTPLTTIRGNVDLLKKIWSDGDAGHLHLDEDSLKKFSIEAVDDIAGESQRMSRLVNDLLSLARADAGHTLSKEPLALSTLIEEVVRRAQFLPRQVDWVQGDLDAVQDASVLGSKDYLQQMLFIFIENAFKYTSEGSVMMDAVRSGDQVGIRIVDTGIGMDRSEVPLIFERFYRADPSRGVTQGTGLGLSIAQWIIDEHDGSVEVMTKLGVGTTFIIWLPATFNALPE
ncbi:Signal transduction histidine kinase [Fontibacillus panacisegetis]|uniref:histidine kinase n=1 Tax=Fontibacillus panacisegetis TaxID=670482 RepID=A0A1G7P9F4_9BACL|nr:HAMP domain-containing sensor histidine kinase [Fontibacillus panacisegetis]SDF82945.1 Signal transduction histidine kinase [Fontibacillus panacisegetis]